MSSSLFAGFYKAITCEVDIVEWVANLQIKDTACLKKNRTHTSYLDVFLVSSR